MSKSYNAYQEVFGLSLAANLAEKSKGNLQYLQNYVQTNLPPLIRQNLGNTWQIVWGPVVWKNQPNDANTGPDNTWFVVRNPAVVFEDGKTYDTYVIAIAATATRYDWIQEDFEVSSVVDYPAWIKSSVRSVPERATSVNNNTGTYVAYGTAKAVHTLLTQTAPQGTPSPFTLYDYLASIPPALPGTMKVVVTGHSLGGALSPTVALALAQSPILNRFSPENLLSYPSAGATPGNANFATLFAKTFPKKGSSGYKVWNCNIVNTIDIVPQGWCTNKAISPNQNIWRIPTIYGSPTLPSVDAAVYAMAADADLSKVTYFPLQSSTFTGVPPSTVPKSWDEFLADASEQHADQYEIFVGVIPPKSLTEAVEGFTEEE